MPPIPQGLASTVASPSSDDLTLQALLEGLKQPDPEVRTGTWRRAPEVGAPAVQPLVELMGHENSEIARAAKRGLWHMVRHAGRPGAEEERAALETELDRMIQVEQAVAVLRELLWMVSEIGTDRSVPTIAALLSREDTREDAKMALERIPGDRSLEALKQAIQSAPEGSRPSIAHSLRVRGVEVSGYPSKKLQPSKKTEVQPIP